MVVHVAFNRGEAVRAGLIIDKTVNGSPEGIQAAEQRLRQHDGDLQFVQWLKQETSLVTVPGTRRKKADTGCTVDTVIRAIPGSYTYRPLIQWLLANGITWYEFSMPKAACSL